MTALPNVEWYIAYATKAYNDVFRKERKKERKIARADRHQRRLRMQREKKRVTDTCG